MVRTKDVVRSVVLSIIVYKIKLGMRSTTERSFKPYN